MSRDLDPGLADAIVEPVVRPALAIRIELPDPVYVWTGQGTLSFADADGVDHEWLGAGGLGSIDSVGEGTDGSAVGIKVALNQIPSEFRDDIADQAERGSLFEVYVIALNETYQQVDAVQLIWKGRVDDYKITDGGVTLAVEVVGESRGIDQRRPAQKKFTDEYQQRQHPGDLFFQYVPQMTEVPILWARATQESGATIGSGGGATGPNVSPRTYNV